MSEGEERKREFSIVSIVVGMGCGVAIGKGILMLPGITGRMPWLTEYFWGYFSALSIGCAMIAGLVAALLAPTPEKMGGSAEGAGMSTGTVIMYLLSVERPPTWAFIVMPIVFSFFGHIPGQLLADFRRMRSEL